MQAVSLISSRIWYTRKKWWRRSRIVFPSPAELQFIRIMGGRVLTFKWPKSTKTGFTLAMVISPGKILKREFVQREYRVGAMYVDFAFITRDSKKCIEVDGKQFHRDIVKEQDRDDYLHKYGWQIMHITAGEIYVNPDAVQRRVIAFLAR